MLSSPWFPWILILVILVILPVALALLADDHPRSDDPPDTGDEDERDSGPSVLPVAA